MLPLADAFARAGIEALVFDKRGVGGSGGDWRTATMEDLAGDVRAAVHLLARRADVDGAALGVYGHSQGAEIAPDAARANPEVRWIVAADGPVGPQYRQDLFRVRNILAKKYAGAQLAEAMFVYRDFVTVARTGIPHGTLRAEIARAGGAPWLADLAIPPDESWIWRWYRSAGNYDNRAAWAAVRVPVLAVYGADDEIVPPSSSIAQIRALVRPRAGASLDVLTYAGADHTLRVPPREKGGWPRYAPGYPAGIVRWIVRVTGRSPA
jgi:pimeloyl-ACP methyl ester carboxylesterase